MKGRLTVPCAVVLAVLLPLMVTGQQKKAKTAGPVSLTGCLNKGADANHFSLKNDKGKQFTIVGDAATLSKHANNHNVTIKGVMEKEQGKNVINMKSASDLKMNSVCN